jgi:O-antigen ligase
VVAASSFGSKGRFEKWALIFLVSAALVGIDACFQKFLGLEFMFHHGMTAVHFAGRTEFAATGAFKHANALAAYLICALPLLAGMTVSLKTSYRFPLSIVVFLLTISLALTFSRGGWLGFIIALGLMIICLPQKRFFLALGGVFIFSIFLLSGGSERAAVSFQPGGDSGRYQLWGGAWAMIQNHPLVGQGVGTFMAFFKDYVHGRGMMYAHNCYLQIWAETGIFGLLSFLMFIGLVFRSGLIALRQSVDGKTGGILVGLLCGVVAFLIQSALDTNLYSLQLSAMFWLFLGMIQALSCPAREARRIHNGGSI